MELIQTFERSHVEMGEAGALFSWAVWTTESLHYLDDIDRAYDSAPPIEGQSRDVLDVAHARWATGTSITAIDLCAAGLGRAFCGQTGRRGDQFYELDFGNLAPSGTQAYRARLRKQLPALAREWVDAAYRDPRYDMIMDARHALTHRRVPRILSASMGSGREQRLGLRLTTGEIGVRRLIEDARDYATHHVSEFLEVLPRLVW